MKGLCTFVEQRTYEPHFVINEIDIRGLMKVLAQKADEYGEPYETSLVTLQLLFCDYSDGFHGYEGGETPKNTNYWTDFMRRYEDEMEMRGYGIYGEA